MWPFPVRFPSLGKGCLPDERDDRDFKYSEVMGGDVAIDWDLGYDAYKDLAISPITQDQGTSESCTAQAGKSYARRWLVRVLGDQGNQEQSAGFIYPQIRLPNGGAYIRDSALVLADKGSLKESILPSYDHGDPPSEAYFLGIRLTPDQFSQAVKYDLFSARSIPGNTWDMDVFAHAIRNNLGCMMGFTGTDNGWCRPVVRPPKFGENAWGHCVDVCAYGKLDIDILEFKKGTKCLFTTNSWGGRYAISSGRWKGYQAIPEDYFLASQVTAVGTVMGYYVFPAWVLVPDQAVPAQVQVLDLLRKNEGKIVQDSEQSGTFGLIKDGKILVTSKDRLPNLIATYIVKKEGMPLPKDIWNSAPKADF